MENSEKVWKIQIKRNDIFLRTLASIYQNQRRWNEAEKLEVQVMDPTKKLLGAEHSDTLNEPQGQYFKMPMGAKKKERWVYDHLFLKILSIGFQDADE